MKFVSKLFAVAVLLSGTTTFAKDIPLIEMTGEGCDVKIPLGLQVANNNPRVIEGIYYTDDKRVRRFFSAAALQKMTTVYQDSGYDVASLQLSRVSDGEFKITVQYLRSAIALSNKYPKKVLKVVYNVHINRYEVINTDTNKPVTQAEVYPTKRFGQMVGISRIVLQ